MSKDVQIKVGMLILMESNIEDAVEFYKKVGLNVKFHIKGKWAELNIGSIKLGLCPTTQEPFDRHSGIVLEVSDIKEFQKIVENQGILFVNEPVEAVHGIMGSIKDPSGNVVDIYQPTPEKVKEFADTIVKEEEPK